MRRSLALAVIFFAIAPCVTFFSGRAFAQSGQPATNKLAAAKSATLPNVPDRFTVAVERGDPGKGASSVLIKLAPSCDSRTHWHSADASVLVVGGTPQLEMKGAKRASMRSGDFFFKPAHDIHRERCVGNAPCLLYAELYGPFDVHYVDAEGKNIPDAEALRGAEKSAPERNSASAKVGSQRRLKKVRLVATIDYLLSD